MGVLFYLASNRDGLDENGFIDYDRVEELAREHQPKLIISGTTAYPRTLDWQRFRGIADQVGAYLLADITHIAGLVIAGLQPNPIDIAHFTVTCTHKQLYGSRGGLIMMGKEWDTPAPTGKGTLSRMIQRSLFPFTQGAPIINMLVAKARTLDRAATDEFRQLAGRIVTLSQALANAFVASGVRVISGGTDNHIVLVDVFSSFGVTGIIAEKALEECRIIVNKNFIPGDQNKAFVTSGIRIGTNALAERHFGAEQMEACADLISRVLKCVKVLGEREYGLDPQERDRSRQEVRALCDQFPIPGL